MIRRRRRRVETLPAPTVIHLPPINVVIESVVKTDVLWVDRILKTDARKCPVEASLLCECNSRTGRFLASRRNTAATAAQVNDAVSLVASTCFTLVDHGHGTQLNQADVVGRDKLVPGVRSRSCGHIRRFRLEQLELSWCVSPSIHQIDSLIDGANEGADHTQCLVFLFLFLVSSLKG